MQADCMTRSFAFLVGLSQLIAKPCTHSHQTHCNVHAHDYFSHCFLDIDLLRADSPQFTIKPWTHCWHAHIVMHIMRANYGAKLLTLQLTRSSSASLDLLWRDTLSCLCTLPLWSVLVSTCSLPGRLTTAHRQEQLSFVMVMYTTTAAPDCMKLFTSWCLCYIHYNVVVFLQ